VKELRESALETALRTVPATFSIDVRPNSRHGGVVTVRDCVGTEVLGFAVWPSNSGDTCGMGGRRMSYLKEWDEMKVRSKVVYGFYERASSKPKPSYEAAILRELVLRNPGLPPAVADTVARVRELYAAARGGDAGRALEEARKVMRRMSRLGLTEVDLVREWRETLVREVQDS
jgi:hypothetical protein